MSDEKTKTNAQPPAESVKEVFLPPSDWDRQNDSDTLILMLPGFRKEQMTVQVTSNRMLRLSGGRKISENKIRQFHKEEPLFDYHDIKGITAKFEAGMLYVRIPKVTKPQPPPTQQEPSKPQPPPTTTSTQQEPSKPQSPPTTTTTQQEPPKPQPPPTTTTTPTQQEPSKPQSPPTTTPTQQESPKPQPPPTTTTPPTQQEPSKPQTPTTTPTLQKPPKPQQTTTTDHKPYAPQQQHVDEKETKEDKSEESKTITQTPLPQEPKADQEDLSQKKPQKLMSKAETEEKSKTSETHQEMHGTTQTAFKEQKADHDEDSQKKEKGKAETDGNVMGEAITSKAQGTSPDPDGLSKSIVAMMHKILDMISDFVLEVKKQHKVPHFVVLIFLVLLIGLYIKSVVKSSFGEPENQEL